MGMLVNVEAMMDPMVLLAGGGFAIVAVLAKILGGGLPALGMNFNLLGATRIGLGMVSPGRSCSDHRRYRENRRHPDG
jgi:Kef-type K+ transport system membrane component KefB